MVNSGLSIYSTRYARCVECGEEFDGADYAKSLVAVVSDHFEDEHSYFQS